MVDRDLILRKLATLDGYMSQVSEYRDITVEQYRGDWKTQRIIERTFNSRSRCVWTSRII